MTEELKELKQIFIDSCENDLPIKNTDRPFELIDKIAIQMQAEVGIANGDIGVTKPVNKPEDMPETILVKTKDFIQLMSIGGMLCDLKPPESAKKKFNKEIREIAVRHHINFVGEIK